MEIIHIIILSLLQGITEFIPVSSSGHLVVLPSLMNWQDQGPLMDIAVHVGTLCSVVLYLRHEIIAITKGLLNGLRGRGMNHDARMGLYVVYATIPVIIAGYVVHKFFNNGARSIEVVAWMTLIFGVVLYWGDRFSSMDKGLSKLNLKPAIVIGIAQVLALIPGVSRSGITITAGRMLGFDRISAAKFSFLLSIPTILGAGVLATRDLYLHESPDAQMDHMIAVLVSFLVSFGAIMLMMRWLEQFTYTPFAIYRLVLGTGLLLWIYV